MAIGYERARNLMRQLGWKMRVRTSGDGIEKIMLFHPCQQNEYRVYMESGRKLLRECVVSERLDKHTAILSYNRSEAEVESPKWFAVTRWAPEDAVEAAAKQGIVLSMEQAITWWTRNGRHFQKLLYEQGREILAKMDFREVETDESRPERGPAPGPEA